MVDEPQEKTALSKHSRKHYAIVFAVLFLILTVILLFVLDKTVGLQNLLSPSAGIEEGLLLKKNAANRVLKDRNYMDLDKSISITLYDEQQQAVFLNIGLTLELQLDSDRAEIRKLLPTIYDSVETYLRGVRVGELSGTQGIYRVREELLFRINRLIAPITVNDVLFREFQFDK